MPTRKRAAPEHQAQRHEERAAGRAGADQHWLTRRDKQRAPCNTLGGMRSHAGQLLTLALLLPMAAAGARQPEFLAAPPQAQVLENPWRSAADLAAGKALFLAHCAACHGAAGEGSGPIPPLGQPLIRQASDGALFWYLTRGSANGDMPAWVAIPESDRWKIVGYLKTLPDSRAARVADHPDPAVLAAKLAAPPPRAPFTDFRYEHPGVVRRIRIEDLPAPFATPAVANAPTIVARPADVWPQVPHGFRVSVYVAGLDAPRVIRVAPNGDVFVAETGAGRILVYRGADATGAPLRKAVFAGHLHRPYGIAFYPQGDEPRWVYVADTQGVRRYAYRSGELAPHEPAPEQLISLGSDIGHWTRDIAFSQDGRQLFLAVGSASNDDDADSSPAEQYRANILAFDPQGRGMRVYASGIRNPSGIAVDSRDGRLWCSVNERDGLGDDLVPDYVSAVQEGGFYGWPWWYMGAQDPRHPGKHPELKHRVLAPDVLIQPHSASLQLVFYYAPQFPPEYRGDLFATEHGSWNRRCAPATKSSKSPAMACRTPVASTRIS